VKSHNDKVINFATKFTGPEVRQIYENLVVIITKVTVHIKDIYAAKNVNFNNKIDQ
jgi:formyltetrahydrofolate synthetase